MLQGNASNKGWKSRELVYEFFWSVVTTFEKKLLEYSLKMQ